MIINSAIRTSLKSIDPNIAHANLWSLSDPRVVWDTYERPSASASMPDYQPFFEHVNTCIKRRIQLANTSPPELVEDGMWLLFQPAYSMFEDVAVKETNGFFGSGDCPPPAFWTHVNVDTVVSFIPQRHVETVSVGIELCVSDNLKWQTK